MLWVNEQWLKKTGHVDEPRTHSLMEYVDVGVQQ